MTYEKNQAVVWWCLHNSRWEIELELLHQHLKQRHYNFVKNFKNSNQFLQTKLTDNQAMYLAVKWYHFISVSHKLSIHYELWM